MVLRLPYLFMLKQEYEKLAKRYASCIEYSVIERIYMEDSREKDMFVKALIDDEDGIQQKVMELVDLEVDKRCANARKPYAEKVLELEAENKKLKNENNRLIRELEMALEFVPYECSNMDDISYDSLRNFEETELFSEDQAKKFIASEFGFDESKIDILFEIDQCKIDRLKRIHYIGTKERVPVYGSSDWNYVRFNVVDMAFECVNGDLYIL